MDIHKVSCLDVSRSKRSEVNLVKAIKSVQISTGITLMKGYTYTTLSGFDSLNIRTPVVSRTTKKSNFHSPDVIVSPPGG